MSTAHITIPQLGSTCSSATHGGPGTGAASDAGPVAETNLRQLLRSIALLAVVCAIVVTLLAAVRSLDTVTRQLGHAHIGRSLGCPQLDRTHFCSRPEAATPPSWPHIRRNPRARPGRAGATPFLLS